MPLIARPFQNYINLRNHRKIFVFDGTTVLAGGMNLSQKYMGPVEDRKRWIDLLFQIRGPAVFHYHEIFMQDWIYTTKTEPELPEYFPESFGDTTIQVVPSGLILQQMDYMKHCFHVFTRPANGFGLLRHILCRTKASFRH